MNLLKSGSDSAKNRSKILYFFADIESVKLCPRVPENHCTKKGSVFEVEDQKRNVHEESF